MWWTRLKALILKELLAVLRDPRARIILIVPPVIQLVVFSYAATLEVRNVDVMVLNRDAGRWGHELVQRIEGSPTFRKVSFTHSPEALHEAVDRQTVLAAIHISPTFSRDIEGGQPTDVQVILDGRRSNASQIVGGYLNQIVAGLSADTPARSISMQLKAEPSTPASRQAPAASPRAAPRPAAEPEAPQSSTVYTGSIYVDSRPRGARVTIDGKEVGLTPLRVSDVKIGSHVVRLELPDHRLWSSTTRVISGQEQRVTGSLERIQ